MFVNNEDGSETYTNLDSPTATTVQLFEHTYILNISSKKIHSTDCASVKTIKDENREESHLSIDELEERYGQRVVSRLNSFEVVNFIGTDIRQIKK